MITNRFHLFVAICWGYTSLKTKMETQNHDLEKVTPFERWDLVGWQWYIKFPFLVDQTMQSMVILKDFPYIVHCGFNLFYNFLPPFGQIMVNWWFGILL